MFHIVAASVCFLSMFVLIQVMLARYLNRGSRIVARAKMLALFGLSFCAVMVLGWMFSVEVFDLTHPHVQMPLPVRIPYTYIVSILGITSMALWLRADKKVGSR
ncbi:MAG: hypothetical protein NVS9B2_30190 [Steroidobacteraceae bacterium]